MKVLLFLDCETTGLNCVKNDIVQLAAIAIIDGVRHPISFNEFAQPLDYTNIDAKATEVHGLTTEKMKKFQTAKIMISKFISFVKSISSDKVTISGYNVEFDRSFISSTFHKLGLDCEFRDLFEPNIHDVFRRAKAAKDQLGIKSLKLVNVAAILGVDLTKAHDALADISATIEVDNHLAKMLSDEGIATTHEDLVEISLPEIPHLHLHSEYSYRDSVVSMEDWLTWAKENKISAISFPDHDLAASTFKCLNQKDKDYKTTNHDGVTVVPAVSFLLDIDGNRSWFPRLNAWAVSNEGYRNILKLASLGWDKRFEVDKKVSYPVVTIDELRNMDGVIFGSGCEKGLFVKNGIPLSSSLAFDYVSMINDVTDSKFVLELLGYDIHAQFDSNAGFKGVAKTDSNPDGNISKVINNTILDCISRLEIGYILSTAAHFIKPDEKVIQDVVSRSAFKDGRYFYESRHQRSSSEVFTIIKRHLPDWMNEDRFTTAAATAMNIVNKAKDIRIKHEYHLPKIEIPDYIVERTDNYNKQLYLLMMAKIKDHGRWSEDPVYIARFKKELDVIWKNKTLNFIPYFLLYEDIGSFARKSGILQGIARGSAGGSLLSYYLKIIHIDPIKENLPFERFLSHARINAGSFPDIDCDFGSRELILTYLKTKYSMGFAQIGTLLTFKTKNAIKDAMFSIYGRNRADKEILMLCDTIPDSPQGIDETQFLYGYIDSEGVNHKGHLEENQILQAFFAQYPDAANIVRRLIGLPRATGRHASGFVISTLNLSNARVPTMLVDDGTEDLMPVTQYEAGMVEKCGLIKADILGVTTIGTIAECVRMIGVNGGVNYLEEDDKGMAYIYRLPEEKNVYEDFYLKKTDSSFQFNTDLIKSFIQGFSPVCRNDLSILTALVRPGALDVKFEGNISATQWYVDVRNGERETTYIHPDLELILKETNGVITFQEQLMEILVKFCGYTLEESDQIRSAIAKKKKEVMTKAFEKIRIETAKIGWTLAQAEELCKVLTAYSNYSFNRSHSRAYSELGYITMYLKNKHPLEWWCAELNSCVDKTTSEDKLRHYTNLLGERIVPANLMKPSNRFVILDGKISAPLSVIKGLGPASINEIVSKGPYTSLRDFATKVGGQKCGGGHFASLVRARVVDCFMTKSLPYPEARLKVLQEYVDIKKCRPLPVDIYDVDPLSIFLSERSVNKCFNKSLMLDQSLRAILLSKWTLLKETGRKAIPLMMGSVPIVGSVKAANAILEKQDEIEVGFIGLYEGSEVFKGVSKKTNKPFCKLEVKVSDGAETLSCDWWKVDHALRLPIDSIVYIRGTLKRGWRGAPTINIQEVQRIGEEE